MTEYPGSHRFHGATLFMNVKNTEPEFTNDMGSLNIAYDSREEKWSRATDPHNYNKGRKFVGLKKQITTEDGNLPHNLIPDGTRM
jgi:hypothetical protein